MFEDLKKHEEFDFFAENRLVFREPKGKKKPSETAKKKPLTAMQARARAMKLLEKLRGETFADKPDEDKPKDQPTRTHTQDRHTRTVTKPEPYYPESVKKAQEAAELEGLMNSKETNKMQIVHDNLYRQYINPAFMMHLKAKGYSEKVFPLLNMVMEQPNKFEYRSKGNNVLHIVRREPYTKPTDKKDEIPKDFLVVMEGKQGSISQVGKIELKVNGKIPWISNEKFNKDSEIYSGRRSNEFRQYLWGWGRYIDPQTKKLKTEWGPGRIEYQEAGWRRGTPERKAEWKKQKRKAAESVSRPIKEIHLNMNVEFPKRFVDLVKSRNLDFEMNDPQVEDIIDVQSTNWKSYKELYEEPNQPKMMVVPHPTEKGIYKIMTREYDHNSLHIDVDGYILRPPEDGSSKWKRDPRYDEAVRRKYYRHKDHQKAKVDLDPVEKKRMEDTDNKEKLGSSTVERAKKIDDFILRREAVDKKVYSKRTRIEDLRRTAIAIQDPNKSAAFNARRAAIIGRANRKQLREEIKVTLDGDLGIPDETRNDIAARELGVPLF